MCTLVLNFGVNLAWQTEPCTQAHVALVLGCRQQIIKQAYKGFIIMVTVLECKTTCLLDLPSVLDHHETALTFAFQRWLEFLLCTFPQWQWHHRQTLRSTPPLGCKDSAQQGLSMAIASYMIEFPARESEHVSISQLD